MHHYRCVLHKSSEIIDNNEVFKTNQTTAHNIRKNLLVKLLFYIVLKAFEIVSSFTVGFMVNYYF